MTRTTVSAAGAPRPSMADVALLAGVSSQTVSRVSNGHSNVDEQTRARVVQAMRTLGYRPNGAARALKSGRFHTVGVIMTSLQSHGNIRTLDAIAQEAARTNYSVTLLPISDLTPGRVSGAYQQLSAQAVDGAVILLEARLLDQAEFALPPGIPVVLIDSGAGLDYTVVDTDQALGARQATEHLLQLGHRQVWHIAGPLAAFSAARRAGSWARTLREAGITPPPILRGDWTSESGYRHGLTLGRRADVTAIFAANDQMALGVMRALHEIGRDIPGDISIVGFDDTAEASSFWPPLTTIRQDFAAVGRLTIRKLLQKVSGAAAVNDKTTVPTELIVRNSTGRPPAEGSGRPGARMPGGVDARADQSADVREGPVSEKPPARLDLTAPAELAPAQRALYDAITGGPRASQAGTVPIADEAGRLLGPFAIMLLSPELGNAMQQVGAKIRFDTALTGRERELAILTVAGALDSEFERLAHVPAARSLGLTEPQIDAALAGRTADGLSADEAMVSRLALAMTVDRALSDPDYSDGVEALGRPRLAELTWLVGYYSALALSLAVFRPVLPESLSDGR